MDSVRRKELFQSLPDFPGSHTDDVVFGRVVAGSAAKHLRSDLLLVDVFGVALEGLFADIEKESSEDGAFAKLLLTATRWTRSRRGFPRLPSPLVADSSGCVTGMTLRPEYSASRSGLAHEQPAKAREVLDRPALHPDVLLGRRNTVHRNWH